MNEETRLMLVSIGSFASGYRDWVIQTLRDLEGINRNAQKDQLYAQLRSLGGALSTVEVYATGSHLTKKTL